MTAVEELIAKLGLDVSEFKQGLAASGEAVTGLNQKMDMLGKGLAGGAVAKFVTDILSSAEAVVNLADNLGVSTDSLQALTVAASRNGVEADAVQAVWLRARQELDKLRSGNAAAAETFAKLGLSVDDFKGLALDEALQKISAAYLENEQRAGAYDALQEIVGKSGRNLTTTLKELGADGFGAMIKSAKDAHAIIEENTLRDLERVNNQWEQFGQQAKTVATTSVAFVTHLMQTLVMSSATMISLLEDLLKGGLFTQAGRDSLRSTFDVAKQQISEIWTGEQAVAKAAADRKKTAEDTLPSLVEAKEQTAARQKYEEAAGKAAMEGKSTAEKLAKIEEEIAKTNTAIAAAKKGSAEYDKLRTEHERLSAEYTKLTKESIEQNLAIKIKAFEVERNGLPLVEQQKVVKKESAAAEDAIVALNQKGLDTAKAQEELEKRKALQKDLEYKKSEELVKNAGDLLSLDRQTAEAARIRNDLLQGRLTKEAALSELNILLAKGAANLTEQERARLAALAQNLTIRQKEAELAPLLGRDVATLTAAERERLAVLTGQLDALKNQKVEIDSIIDAWTNFSVAMNRVGTDYGSQSTTALQGLASRLQSQVDSLGLDTSYASALAPTAKNPQYYVYANELANVQRELARRQEIGSYLELYGEDRTRYTYGDTLTNQALQDLSASSKATAENIQTISDVLTGKRTLFGG